MFALIALHVPIGVSMGVTGLLGVAVLLDWGPSFSLLSTELSGVLTNTDLAVIPLFLLMGSLAGVAGLASDIYRVAYAFLGHRRGGLALATIGGCAGFGAVCGSSIATAATMTRVALPEMTHRKYSPGLATGCIAAGGTLGTLIPPSVIMVLYAALTEQFVIALFVAAIIPGLVAILLHFIAVAIYVSRYPDAGPAGPRAPWSERIRVVGQSWGVILLIGMVSGGIYGGVFTVTEGAAVGVIITLIFAIARRKMTVAAFWELIKETAANSGLIYVIFIGASIFTYFVTLTQVPDLTVELIKSIDVHPLVVITLLYVMYLVLGSVFDTVAAMVITMPLVFPLILGLGFDPIWFGIVNVMVIETGLITPPIGLNCFVVNGVQPQISLQDVFRGIALFFVADVITIAVLVFFPQIITWLPDLMRG